MKMDFLKSRGLAFLTVIWLAAETFAAESAPNLSKAKQQADAKGYLHHESRRNSCQGEERGQTPRHGSHGCRQY
jgi:hypothetical protein